MSVQFLHISDLHLGSQLKTKVSDTVGSIDALDSAVYIAVERLFEIAVDEGVDFVVIAGDLYDMDSRSVKANKFLKEQFDRLAEHDIPVYIVYGNHDPVGSAPTYIDLPDNVYEFDDEEPEEFLYPNEHAPKARIWGQSYRSRHESRSFYHRFTPSDGSLPNIGVIHTALNPDGRRYVPVSRSDLESKSEIDYWALGHIHTANIYNTEMPIAYSGVPQGRQITEQGLGGGLLVELDVDGDYEIEFVPTSPVVWKTVEVDVGGEDIVSIPDIERQIEQKIDDLSLPDDLFDEIDIKLRDTDWSVEGYVCRWKLVGNGPVYETLSKDEEVIHEVTQRLRDKLSSRYPFFWTEAVRDETGPPIPSVEELRGNDRVIDEYLEYIEDLDKDEVREQYRGVVGEVWEWIEDHEEREPDKLPLTEEGFDELIDRAQKRVFEELARRRA